MFVVGCCWPGCMARRYLYCRVWLRVTKIPAEVSSWEDDGRERDGGKEGSGTDCLLSRPPSFSSHPSHHCAFQLFTPAEYAPSSPSLDLALAQSSDGRNSASERKRWSPGLHCPPPSPFPPQISSFSSPGETARSLSGSGPDIPARSCLRRRDSGRPVYRAPVV